MGKKPQGFTLLELLVSLSIMGLMATIIFGSINLGIRSWERGNQIAESSQDEFFAWHLVSRQIRSASPFRGEGNNLYFRGEKDEMAFISTYSLEIGDRGGLVRVIYRIVESHDHNRSQLLVYEEPLLDKKRLEEKIDMTDFVEILETDGPIFFSFEKTQAGFDSTEQRTSTWQDHWETEERGMPERVKISRGSGEQEGEAFLILPLFAQEERLL
jgi:prepilin-type N-terminal cleavage/methylation domain-containing protein